MDQYFTYWLSTVLLLFLSGLSKPFLTPPPSASQCHKRCTDSHVERCRQLNNHPDKLQMLSILSPFELFGIKEACRDRIPVKDSPFKCIYSLNGQKSHQLG